jgi:aspartate aminotransferase
MPQLSSILDRFAPSPIAKMSSAVSIKSSQGHRLFDFTTGEPDFDTPRHIKDAAIEAINNGETKYSPTDGTIEVRKAVQRKFKRENNLEFKSDQIIVASGAKPLLADIVRTIAGVGDEIALARPCWPSHVGMIEICGANPNYVDTCQDEGFIMKPEKLAAVLTNRTRVLLLCAPSNPTGAVYPPDTLMEIAEILRQYPEMWVVTDDLYEHIIYDGRKFCTLLEIAPELADRTIVVNGVSKAFAMTGWRIGYAGGPSTLIDGVRKIMTQATGCPSSISQVAAIAALDGPLDCVQQFVRAYQARRDRSASRLNQIPGIDCHVPDGSFYLYPSCEDIIGKKRPDGQLINSSSDFALYLLEDYSVAVVPGIAFKLDPHIRISTATADAILDEGLEQISKAVSQLT